MIFGWLKLLMLDVKNTRSDRLRAGVRLVLLSILGAAEQVYQHQNSTDQEPRAYVVNGGHD